MTATMAMTRQQIRSLLTSGTPWAAATAFAAITGLLFWVNAANFADYSHRAAADPFLLDALNSTQAIIQPTIGNIGVVGALVLPFITMRLVAEERRAGTTEWIRTLPVTDLGTIVAKYAAALTAASILLAASAAQPITLYLASPITWSHVAAGYSGLAGLFATLTAIGLAISALAPTPGVAASIALVANLGLVVLDLWATPDTPGIAGLIARWSPIQRLDTFSNGVIDIQSLAWNLTLAIAALAIATAGLTNERRTG